MTRRGRRAFLTATTGLVASLAGCNFDPPGSETETPTEVTTYDGPTATATLTPSPTPYVTSQATPSLQTVTATPSETDTTAPTESNNNDGGGANNNDGGSSGGSSGSNDEPPETTEYTITHTDSGESPTSSPTPEGESPINLTVTTVTDRRVEGELTYTGDESLAWMRAEVVFLRDDDKLQTNVFEVKEPEPDETIPFDVRYTKNTEPDTVRIRTRYAVAA